MDSTAMVLAKKKAIASSASGYKSYSVSYDTDGSPILEITFQNGDSASLKFPLPEKGDKGDTGKGFTTASLKDGHLILEQDDGTEIDCGVLPTSDYDDTAIKTSLSQKVDKVTGKSLIDDTEIARLAAVDNYNDTVIKQTISTVANGLMASAGYSSDYKTIEIITKGGDKKSIDVSPIISHANLSELSDVDSANQGDGKTLIYNAATRKHEYAEITGTDEKVKMDASSDAKYLADLIDGKTLSNESGTLKVKTIDGLEATIKELNYIKGLTMPVQDLVTLFANGGLKTISTPFATYADLATYDTTTLLDDISYLARVLADETRDNKITVYMIKKGQTDTVFYGYLDESRDFTTNPISLSSEVKDKLDAAHIDTDALFALLSINDTYKTATAKDEPFGTNGAKAMYDEIVNDISGKANADTLTAHTSDTDIHVSTAEKETWNKVADKADSTDLTSHTGDTTAHVTASERTTWNNKIDKSSISESIDSTSKKDQVSCAKAVYDLVQANVFKHIKTNDIFADALDTSNPSIFSFECSGIDYTGSYPNANHRYGRGLVIRRGSVVSTTVIWFGQTLSDGTYIYSYLDNTWKDQKVLTGDDIATSISRSSTDLQVPSAKAAYNELSKRAHILYDCFESTGFNYKLKTVYGLTADSTIQDVITSLNGNSNKDYGIVSIYTNANNSAFNASLPSGSGGNIYIFPSTYGIISSDYERCTVVFMPYRATDYMWINPCIDATLQGWKKICSTKVKDLYNNSPTFSDKTNYSISDNTNSFIEVKNGWCFVNLPYVKCVSPSTVTLMTGLPKPRKSSYMQFAPVNNESAISLECGIKNDGTLQIQYGTAGVYYRIVFSYPVAES
jgi:hypothetical protein